MISTSTTAALLPGYHERQTGAFTQNSNSSGTEPFLEVWTNSNCSDPAPTTSNSHLQNVDLKPACRSLMCRDLWACCRTHPGVWVAFRPLLKPVAFRCPWFHPLSLHSSRGFSLKMRTGRRISALLEQNFAGYREYGSVPFSVICPCTQIYAPESINKGSWLFFSRSHMLFSSEILGLIPLDASPNSSAVLNTEQNSTTESPGACLSVWTPSQQGERLGETLFLKSWYVSLSGSDWCWNHGNKNSYFTQRTQSAL